MPLYAIIKTVKQFLNLKSFFPALRLRFIFARLMPVSATKNSPPRADILASVRGFCRHPISAAFSAIPMRLGLRRNKNPEPKRFGICGFRLCLSRKIFGNLKNLFAVVADGLHGAGFHRFRAKGGFVVARGLLGHERATGVAHFKKAFGRRGAQSATYALGVDIKFAGYIEFVFFVFVCHNA